jgi:iron complex transport system ATP-binding protein
MSEIELQDIKIAYAERVLIENLNLQLAEGEILAVIGSNGSGKSSLLRALAGLQLPNMGEVRWKGVSLEKLSHSQRPLIAGSFFSNFVRVNGFTVEDLVALGRQPYTGLFGKLRREDWNKVHAAIERVGLVSYRQRQIAELSDGEFQKAMLAKLLAQDTPLLILDEPTTHLDLPAAVEFMGLLRSLAKEKKTIVFSTHQLSLAFQMVERILLLNGAGEYALGSPEEIGRHELLCGFLKTNKIRIENRNLIFDFRNEA